MNAFTGHYASIRVVDCFGKEQSSELVTAVGERTKSKWVLDNWMV